jgi:transcriptional regulator
MLIHPWDRATREEWRDFLARRDFGQLVTAGHVRGYPVIVPTHFLYDGGDTVELHLARPNPVWQAVEEDAHVVLALADDYVYVEAAWNADAGADPDLGVPTSYYTAVQLHGTVELVDDPDEKAAILARQLRHFEPAGSTRRVPSTTSESDRRLLPGIRGMRLHLESVRAKQKYGGNKTVAHRQDIADRLANRAGPRDAAAREQLIRRTPREW